MAESDAAAKPVGLRVPFGLHDGRLYRKRIAIMRTVPTPYPVLIGHASPQLRRSQSEKYWTYHVLGSISASAHVFLPQHLPL